MKKTVLIICTLLISTLPAQAMDNQLFKGVTATAGAAAGVSWLGWYYYNSKQTDIASRLGTLKERLNRLAEDLRQNNAAQHNATTEEDRNALLAESQRICNKHYTALTNYSAQLNTLEPQRLYAIEATGAYKQRLIAATTIGVAAGIKSGLITPKAAALTAVVAGAAERIYSYRADKAPVDKAVGLYDAAQNCKYAMLASGATALVAAGAQYVPGMISSAVGMLQAASTTTKVGIGLSIAAGAVALGIKIIKLYILVAVISKR